MTLPGCKGKGGKRWKSRWVSVAFLCFGSGVALPHWLWLYVTSEVRNSRINKNSSSFVLRKPVCRFGPVGTSLKGSGRISIRSK